MYFCAGDGVGNTETLDDSTVCTKTALAAQINNIKNLFLILKMVEVEKECAPRDEFGARRTGQQLIRDCGSRWLGKTRRSMRAHATDQFNE